MGDIKKPRLLNFFGESKTISGKHIRDGLIWCSKTEPQPKDAGEGFKIVIKNLWKIAHLKSQLNTFVKIIAFYKNFPIYDKTSNL